MDFREVEFRTVIRSLLFGYDFRNYLEHTMFMLEILWNENYSYCKHRNFIGKIIISIVKLINVM